MTILEELTGPGQAASFMQDFFLKGPFVCPQKAGPLRSLGSWRTVEEILTKPDADVMVVRQGDRWGGSTPTYQQARELFNDGYTVLIRHAERQHPELAALAKRFEEAFAGPVDVHLYCTPGSKFGFGWHYDAEDVFILQTEGQKEYSLRKNSVNPWPLVETLPKNMNFEREIMPVMRCTLAAGDWLYIPNGYWHKAEARVDALSLAVGVLPPTAIDVLDLVRLSLRHSLLWRQRLPNPGAAATESTEELAEQYRAIFAQLGDDLQQVFRDPKTLKAFLKTKGRE